MAKKYIACVEQEKGHITQLRVKDGSWQTVKREVVVGDILYNKADYYTMYQKPGSTQLVEGAKVEVVPVGDINYLRTDRNNTPRDNLDNLPSLTVCPV